MVLEVIKSKYSITFHKLVVFLGQKAAKIGKNLRNGHVTWVFFNGKYHTSFEIGKFVDINHYTIFRLKVPRQKKVLKRQLNDEFNIRKRDTSWLRKTSFF